MAGDPIHSFAVADYVVFALTVVISIAIGLYYAISGGRQRTTAEYLLGDRQMSVIPVALSLMVSFESSIMMLGYPAEIYVYGVQFWLTIFGFGLANIIGVRIIVPLFHPLGITSGFEYLQLRYKTRVVRLLGTILGILSYVFYMGIVLYGPAVALQAVTNFPFWGSVVSVTAASVIYTVMGGIKAVIWTDVFQSLVMFMGIFANLIKGTMVAGGPKRVWDINGESGRLNFFNFDTDPTVRHSFWCLTFGSGLRFLGLIFNQSTVQRVCSTKTVHDATKVMLLVSPAFFITLSLACLEGMVAFAYYHTIGCDPLAAGHITNPNQIMPFMVMDAFQGLHGMPGLFMASLFSASLSTLSSGLSSVAAQTWEDIIKPHMKTASEAKATAIAKISVVFYGCLAICVSFMMAEIGGPMSQMGASILAAFGGPMTGLFLYSIFCPWATVQGALSGGITGAALVFWLSLGQNFSGSKRKTPWLPLGPTHNCPIANTSVWTNITQIFETETATTLPVESTTELPPVVGLDKFYSLSYQWNGAVGILSVIVIGTVISFIIGAPKPKDVDSRYILSMFDQLYCCLPLRLRKFLRCGYEFKKITKPVQLKKGEEIYKIKAFEYEKQIQQHSLDTDKFEEIQEMTLLAENCDISSGHINASQTDGELTKAD